MRVAIRAGLMALLAAAPLSIFVPAHAQPIPGTTCSLFPSTSSFNTDISSVPVNANSATWKSNMAQNSNLHPDMGTFAQQYGEPGNIAPPPASGLTPTFLYDSESDHPTEGYPIDQNTLIEGGPGAPSGSDRHALVVNKNNCKLYEIYNLQNFTNGQTPPAGSGAVWDLSSNAMRPIGWTSADAAGLPMTPLLLRSDEVIAGSITHAIRFTAHCTSASYIWPASHQAGSCSSSFPPMGARFRLRSSFNISGYGANTQVVLRAFQHYGLILADNGADWFFAGTTDDWWGTPAGVQMDSELKTIPASEFDAIDESSLQVAAGSYQATPPTPCTNAALSPAPTSPSTPGAAIIWTGSATGCPNTRYRFWELDPGSRWSMVQDYGSSNTYTWHSPSIAGMYRFEVDVRDANESVAYDMVANATYVLQSGAACTNVGLTLSPSSPGGTGVAVTMTGSSSTCTNPVYRFWVRDPGSRWSMVQDYSAATTHLWSQTGMAGTYSLEVDVRDASESVAYDVVANTTYVLQSGAACTNAGLTLSPPSPGGTGVPVTMTGSSSTCTNPVYRFWVRDPGSRWSMVQDYSPATTHLWSQTGMAGTYSLEVDVRDASESVAYDTVFNTTYAATPCSAAGLTAIPSSPQAHGTPITLTGSATCLGTATYRFWVRAPGGSWQIVRDYSTSITFSWTPATAGSYALEVDVRDQGGTDTYETVRNISYSVT